MAIAPSRRLRPLIPHPDGRRAIAVAGDLPAVDIETLEGEPTSAAAARWLREIGLRPWMVECAVDQIDPAALGDRPREALVETPVPPAGWELPAGWAWTGWHDLRPQVADGVAGVCADRLAERRGERDVPAERSEWARPGWYERAVEWIECEVAAAGRSAPDAVVQFRHWGGSAVMRVDLGQERWWFKATIPLFGAEPAITLELSRRSHGATGAVIAIDADRGWLLLEEVDDVGDESPEHSAAAIDRLVELQRSFAPAELDRLVAAGADRRPLRELPERIEHVLRSPIAVDVAPQTTAGRTAVVERLHTAIAAIEGFGLPTTLVHGDFHPGNVARSVSGPVIFDWSDACIGSPVVDIGPWASWYADDPERDRDVWRWFRDAWERRLGVDLTGLERRDVDVVTGAFHLDSYVRILETLEPFRRDELGDGVSYFGGLLTTDGRG